MMYTFFHNSRIYPHTKNFGVGVYLLVAGSIAIFAIVAIGTAAYRGGVAQEERKLIERTETIALSLDPREIAFLAGDISDLENPFYTSLKKRLADVTRVNPDIRFVYLAGEKDGPPSPEATARQRNIFLYLDSEPENSPDHSPPGEVYTKASTVFQEVFDTGLSRFERPLSDRWGERISAFVAINHPRTGERLAVLGVDIDAFEYQKKILFAMITPTLFVFALFLVFLVGYVRYKKEKEILYLKAEFLSIAAHDLRAPLTGVLWALEALQKSLSEKGAGNQSPDSRTDCVSPKADSVLPTADCVSPKADSVLPTAEIVETIGKIEYTLKFMKKSIQGILASSRLLRNGLPFPADGEESPSSASIPLIIANVVLGLGFTAQQRDVSVSIDSTLRIDTNIRTAAPAEKVRHIFANIISNAIKYSKEGGRVHVAYTFENGWHIVSVQDGGIGIPERDQRKIFSEQFRASNNASKEGGAGLGLYFTKHLVDECGGRIWFASEENNGTKFYIELSAV